MGFKPDADSSSLRLPNNYQDNPQEEQEVYTYSELGMFYSCPRAHKIAYVDCLVNEKRSAKMNTGSLFHVGAALWLKTFDLNKALEAIHEERIRQERDFAKWEIEVKPEDEVELDYAEDVAMAMLQKFVKHKGLPDDIVAIVDTEVEFKFPLVDFWVAGKVDGIAINKHGYPVIIEWKTSDKDLGDLLILEWQVPFYAFCIEQFIKYQPKECDLEIPDEMFRQAYFLTAKRPSSAARPAKQETSAQRVERLKLEGAWNYEWVDKSGKDKLPAKEVRNFPRLPETQAQFKKRILNKYDEEPENYFFKNWYIIDRNAVKSMSNWIVQTVQMIRYCKSWLGLQPTPPPGFNMLQCGMCRYKKMCSKTGGFFRKKTKKHEELEG